MAHLPQLAFSCLPRTFWELPLDMTARPATECRWCKKVTVKMLCHRGTLQRELSDGDDTKAERIKNHFDRLHRTEIVLLNTLARRTAFNRRRDYLVQTRQHAWFLIYRFARWILFTYRRHTFKKVWARRLISRLVKHVLLVRRLPKVIAARGKNKLVK